MNYNWEQSDWPNFNYEDVFTENNALFIAAANNLKNLIIEKDASLLFDLNADFLVDEILASSKIEGENYKKVDIMNAILNIVKKEKQHAILFKSSEEFAKLIITQLVGFDMQLTEKLLFSIQKRFLSDRNPQLLGRWRNSGKDMQLISGMGRNEHVQFIAPPAIKMKEEMEGFLAWYNITDPANAIEKAAIAHLYFESIHPFVDGNGRVGRFISLSSLYTSLGFVVPISFSEIILENVDEYYQALNLAQKSNELTKWIHYFSGVITDAQRYASKSLQIKLQHRLMRITYAKDLNQMQLKVLDKMFAAGHKGFLGGMSAQKYCAITKVSKATATRHLQQLCELGLLEVIVAGRSTSYILNLAVV